MVRAILEEEADGSVSFFHCSDNSDLDNLKGVKIRTNNSNFQNIKKIIAIIPGINMPNSSISHVNSFIFNQEFNNYVIKK